MPYSHDPHEIFGAGIYRLVSPNNPEFPRDALWDAYNMVYDRASEDPEKLGGLKRLGTNTVNDVVSGLFDYDQGTEQIATSEDGGVYRRTTGDWAAVTGGGASTFSTTDGVRWSGTMFYGATSTANLLILTNSYSGNAPRKYTTSTISVLGGSPPTAGQFPTAFAGRLWMAAGDTLHYSAADDAETWSGTGGSFQCDRGTGDITGLYNFAGNLLIFKRRKILRMLPGTSLASTSIRNLTSVLGTPSHYTIAETTGTTRSGTLLFSSDEGTHEIVPTQATGGFFIRNAAEAVKPILDRRSSTNLATTWATYNSSRGEYYHQYTLNDAHPDEGLIGNMARGKTPRWTLHDMRNKTAGCMYLSSDEPIQLIGDTSGRVFQMHSGHDRDGAGYRGFVTTAYLTQGERNRMKVYGRVYLDVQTDGTYPIQVHSTLGRSNQPAPRGSLNQPRDFGAVDGYGSGLWGVAVWGGATSNGQWFRPGDVRRGSSIRLRFETLGADQWWRLLGLDVEYARRRYILAA